MTPTSFLSEAFRGFQGVNRSNSANSTPTPTQSQTEEAFDDEYENEEEGEPPRPYQPQRPRAPSSGSTNSPSVFEYSDTSEEYERGKQAELPSKSSFRLRKQVSTPSMRVVRFNQNHSFSDDDDDEIGAVNGSANQGKRLQQQQQQRRTNNKVQPPSDADPPPPPAIKPSSYGNRSSRSEQPLSNKEETHPKRKTHRKQHIHPSNKSPDWMTQLAYSFRSPSPPLSVARKQHNTPNLSSSSNIEFPHSLPEGGLETPASSDPQLVGEAVAEVLQQQQDPESTVKTSNVAAAAPTPVGLQRNEDPVNSSFQSTETSPLLGSHFLPPSVSASARSTDSSLPSRATAGFRQATTNATHNYVALAASFLRDYEGGRAPTLSTDLGEVTDRQLRLYNYKFGGYTFQIFIVLASTAFFASSMLEGFDLPPSYGHYLTCLNFVGLAVFVMDIWFRHQLRGNPNQTQHSRNSRSERLVKPVILFATILAVENVARVMVTPDEGIVLFSSLFKPLVLFYASSKARDALEALRRILRIVLRVIAMELLLILMFAAVACRLFREFNTFEDLSTSWLSLFELSTTVVNPSVWMPIYQQSPFSAVFFISFIVTAVFYLHSLVLSVVFSTYIQAAAEIHERSAGDREDAIQMAFVALQQKSKRNVVDIDLVRDTLRLLRPHYNAMKINALVEIVDPSDQRVVDFGTFRTKIRQALNASIRTARSATTLATLVELIAVAVAVVNFCYVILVSSKFQNDWFESIQENAGSIITLVAGFELLIRFNPLRIPDFTPLTRLNATFDGLALIAALTSIVGIILYATGHVHALDFILMGRAIDMIRIMRFFQIFRDVVRRSSDVLPALTGPIVLVVTTLHLFVYLGMALWGGAVEVGQHFGEITYLYDLNNFNSYAEGVVTMFQVLVVNDWHAIAEVFLFADRCSSPYIVYPVFIFGNLIGVSIMLNVLTAFFVETFVTKLDDATSSQAESTTTVQKDRDFNIMTAEKTSIRRMSSASSVSPRKEKEEKSQDAIDRGADADSEASSEDLYEFDVYEREGFDKIMETVSGNAQNNDFAQQMCDYLEIFESLTPGREKVGYLICDQRTLERFGNRRFQTKAVGFLTEQELNSVVSDMHAELLVLSARATFTNDRALLRTFPHRLDPLRVMEISASILRRHPAVSLFVLRLLRSHGATSPPTIPE